MQYWFTWILCAIGFPLWAQTDTAANRDKHYSLHFQSTFIPQYHFDFPAAYTGANSLLTSEVVRASVSATIYLAYKPTHNLYLVFNLEAAGGKGLSKTLGIAGFPNGEVYRVGDPVPHPFIGRLYAEYRFPLSSRKERLTDGLNQVAETAQADYLSLLAGKFALTDFFDNSTISHDARTLFMNWSLMGSGGWDYPANTRGYTMGAVVQALYHDWAFRTALTTVPIEANGPQLQFRFNKAMGMVWELEKTHLFQQNEERFTTLHAGIFMNQANMGNYRLALNGGTAVPDITASRSYGRTKWGYYFSTDNHFGWFNHFFRLSWNDGKNETWAFTEIDRSIATGIQLKGSRWKRNQDHFALAFVSNGLSQDHRNYLAKGGYGFLVGDGQLHYGREDILEAYYSMHLSRQVYLSPDYQFVSHPGYNRDRGPVHIVAFRLHAFL